MDLSIIVPVYNVEEYLEECLKSIYKIEEIKYEVILVNDGSKDRSFEIMQEFKNMYGDRTIIIDKQNGGLSSARNAGLRIAQGKYVAFIDSDDFIDPNEFEKIVRKSTEFDLDIGIGNMRYYVPGRIGEPLFRSPRVKDLDVTTGVEFLWTAMQSPKCFREEVVDDIYKREFLIKNNLFFNENIIHEDTEFTNLAYLRAQRVKFLNITFYFYRQREGSIMNKVSEKSVVSLENICDTLFEEYKKSNDKHCKEALATLILSFYSTVVYKRYNGMGDYESAYEKYKEYYQVLKKDNHGGLESKLLSHSIFIPNFLRKLIGKEITNVQKVPKF